MQCYAPITHLTVNGTKLQALGLPTGPHWETAEKLFLDCLKNELGTGHFLKNQEG